MLLMLVLIKIFIVLAVFITIITVAAFLLGDIFKHLFTKLNNFLFKK